MVGAARHAMRGNFSPRLCRHVCQTVECRADGSVRARVRVVPGGFVCDYPERMYGSRRATVSVLQVNVAAWRESA